MKKICLKCGIKKELTEFYKSHSNSDGLHGSCKECHKKYLKKYNKSDKGKECFKKYNRSDKGKEIRKNYNRSDKFKESLKEYRLLPINDIADRIRSTIKNINPDYAELIDHWFISGFLIARYNFIIHHYGIKNLHIDHIIPLSYFDLTDETQFLKAWTKENLRLIPSNMNRCKQNKILYSVIEDNGLTHLLKK